MPHRLSRLWLGIVVVVLLVLIAVGGIGMYVAGEAGQLPWQAEPTRIAVTPFANLPAAGTPEPTSIRTADGGEAAALVARWV